MTLQKCGLNLNRVSKELTPHGSIEFPCAGYSSVYTHIQQDIIPWHWHEELEIAYLKNGRMKIKIPSQSYLMKTGDCIMFNANVLHYGAAVTECELHSIVFSPGLIAENENLVFAKKYMLPLVSSRHFSAFMIQAGCSENMTRWFQSAFEALVQEPCGYEFIVRENLSRMCLFLYDTFQPKADGQADAQNRDHLRIRKMLAFMHAHFAEDLTLSDISCIADISERECLRCFQKTIQLSPIQYLLKYRIMQGAQMLMRNQTDSISEIAIACGFDSPSHFSKLFKRFYNCTPREFRNQNREHIK